MSPTDVTETDQDLQGTGLTDPLQPPPQAAALADVGENLLLIPEPEPSENVPPLPHAAPPPPGQHLHQQDQQVEDVSDTAGHIPEPLAEELTSKSIFFKFQSQTFT